MTIGGKVKLEVDGPPAVAAPAPPALAVGTFRLVQVVVLVVTIAGVVVGLRTTVPGGLAPVDGVAFGLTIIWALVGVVDTRARERVGSKVSPYHLLAGLDALVAMVALTAGRRAAAVHAPSSAAMWRRRRRSSSLPSRFTSSWLCRTDVSTIRSGAQR